MNCAQFEAVAAFEHRFWLQILGDHSRFIMTSLAPVEKEAIKKAQDFIAAFDELLCEARRPLSGSQLDGLTATAAECTRQLRCFKLELLSRHLCDELKTCMTPTFFNHMVNELEEYQRVLECLLVCELPPLCHPIHHHILWVSDAEGHGATLASGLDMTEKDLQETSNCFAKNFRDLYGKALEFQGYLRTGIDRFPALSRYNRQVEKEIVLFSCFLEKLRELLCAKKALGRLLPLVPDHMLREECYFLTKLAQVADIKCPDCDPTRPRLET